MLQFFCLKYLFLQQFWNISWWVGYTRERARERENANKWPRSILDAFLSGIRWPIGCPPHSRCWQSRSLARSLACFLARSLASRDGKYACIKIAISFSSLLYRGIGKKPNVRCLFRYFAHFSAYPVLLAIHSSRSTALQVWKASESAPQACAREPGNMRCWCLFD